MCPQNTYNCSLRRFTGKHAATLYCSASPCIAGQNLCCTFMTDVCLRARQLQTMPLALLDQLRTLDLVKHTPAYQGQAHARQMHHAFPFGGKTPPNHARKPECPAPQGNGDAEKPCARPGILDANDLLAEDVGPGHVHDAYGLVLVRVAEGNAHFVTRSPHIGGQVYITSRDLEGDQGARAV